MQANLSSSAAALPGHAHSSPINQQPPTNLARVTDGVSLFPEGPGGASYLESAIKDVFGEYSGQVIDDLYAFYENSHNKCGDSESEKRLFSFLWSLEFLGRWGDLHLQQKGWAGEYTKDICNQIAFHIQHHANPKDTQALIAQIAQKNSCRILRNASLASIIAVGIIAAVGLLGCQFTLPLAVYISLGALAFAAIAASQFACYTAQRPCVALWQKLMTDTLSEQLSLAVQSNDADTCRTLLEPFRREHSLFPRCNGGLSPKAKPVIKSLWSCFLKIWLEAVEKGDLAVCQAFIEAGVPLNEPLIQRRSNPLSIAMKQKNTDLCKILLAAGAGRSFTDDPNQPPTIDKALWQEALREKDPVICQAFIQTGLVDVNAPLEYWGVPLYQAISYKNPALCAVLLAAEAGQIAGAGPNQPTTLDPSLWWKALEEARWEDPDALAICQLFINSGLVDVNAIDANGRTPLADAISGSARALCKLLLEAGAGRIPSSDPEQPLTLDPTFWRKVLWTVGNCKSLAVCQLFIDSGLVDVDAPATDTGNTPLDLAISLGKEALCKLLLAAGAGRIPSSDQERPSTLDPTFWWKAVEQTKWKINSDALAICQVFIDSGLVDLNAANADGRTPLADAINHANGALCKILLAAGAGRIPNPDPAKPPILDPSLWWKALGIGNTEVCQIFIDSGLVDVNAPHQNGRSPLHDALFNNANADLAKVLLAAGADMNALAPAGITRQYPNTAGVRAPGVSTARPLWQEAVLYGQDNNCLVLAEAAKNPNIKLVLAAYCGDKDHFAEALRAGAEKDFLDQCLTEPAFAYAKNVIENNLKQVDAKHLETVQKEFTQAVDMLPVDSARVVFDYAVWPVLKETPKPAEE